MTCAVWSRPGPDGGQWPDPASGEGKTLIQPRQRPSILLYDWDNTLVDGWAGIAAALNAVFTVFAMPHWTAEDTRARVRVSLSESFPIMFGARWTEARDIFYATLAESHLQHVHPMQGAAEALAAGRAWKQGVVSNKTGRFLRAEVAHLGWQGFFGAVIGAGDAAADKPDPAPIHLALSQLGARADPSVWYLGDTALDMQAARAAGVTAVLIGDASHDLGVDHAAPDLHFLSAQGFAAHLGLLAIR
jgi:phosphoglycolate phosphatase